MKDKIKDINGENNPFYNKKHSEDSKRKIRESNEKNGNYKRISDRMRKNNPMKNPETRKKVSSSLKGRVNPRRGEHLAESSKEKIRNSNYHKNLKGKTYEDRVGIKKAMVWKKKLSISGKGKRKPLSNEHKEKISSAMLDNPKVIDRQNRLWRDKDYKKMMSNSAIKKWENKEYRENQIRAIIKSLLKRPTSYEKKISELCISNNLPFIYTGNGTFLIGYKNPDFINKKEKIAIEVYHNYFKIREFGSCEEYEKQRTKYFARYGWSVLFIRTEEIEDKDWENICLNKICGVENC